MEKVQEMWGNTITSENEFFEKVARKIFKFMRALTA